MQVFLNKQENRWEVAGYYSPVGKIISSTIPSAKTLSSIVSIIEEEQQDGQTFTMLRQRLMDTINEPEVNQRYSKELSKLMKKAEKNVSTKMYLGKGKSVRFRITGHTDSTTIVEPCDNRNHKLLVEKLGYDI